METAIIFDCEFLALRESNRRYWCAPFDPDPVIAQIGAVKLSLTGDFAIADTARIFVKPVDRHGELDTRKNRTLRAILNGWGVWPPPIGAD